MKHLKGFALVALILITMIIATGCDDTTSTFNDIQNTVDIGDTQSKYIPTPTDLGPSITRWVLSLRAYTLNGEPEKALSKPCPIPMLPLGQIEIYSAGTLVKTTTFVGGVVSRDTFLTPDSEYYEKLNSTYGNNKWIPDVDGTYGSNNGGVFWFGPDGNMYEWGGEEVFISYVPGEVIPPTQFIQVIGETNK